MIITIMPIHGLCSPETDAVPRTLVQAGDWEAQGTWTE